MPKQARGTIRVTADANVFYYLGSGALLIEDVTAPGEKLWATPINVLEILAGISPNGWDSRRDAAKAIVTYGDNMAADPEAHLAAVIERRPPAFDGIWLDGAKALAQATSEVELLKGVADFADRVVRKVQPSMAAAAKAQHYEAFKSDIIKVCEHRVPGYKASVEAGTQAPVVEKSVCDEVRAFLGSPDFIEAVFLTGLCDRYRLFGTHKIDLQSEDTFLARRDLDPYCRIYGAYLRELLTARRKPHLNDWGDLELFIYLQPGTFVATAEKKWWTIADSVGLGDRVKKLVPKHPRPSR